MPKGEGRDVKYSTVPQVVDVYRMARDVEYNAPKWFAKAVNDGRIEINRILNDGAIHVYGCTVRAKEGRFNAKIGDYVIRRANGSIIVCISKDFNRYYCKYEKERGCE